MKLKEITAFFEKHAPLVYQESYDNSGIQVGDYTMDLTGALVTFDITEEVIDEAIEKKLNLVIGHHPLIFGGIKSITGKNMVERILIKAIKHDIAIYAAHTNYDAIKDGVNGEICKRIGLAQTKILDPVQGQLFKLVVFVPTDHTQKVREAIFNSGAGAIGNYDSCSYNLKGEGSFRGGEDTNPFAGKKGELHFEEETRIETIFPKHLKGSVISSMLQAHPYEEVAYDIYPLENKYAEIGMGMIGTLEKPMKENVFLKMLKEKFNTGIIKHTSLLGKDITKVAVCGGAGSFLLRKAIAEKADIFITGDIKYHQFFEAESKIIIADIGHFESEQYTRDTIYDLLIKKFPKFAVRLSDINTNPIKYF